MIAATVSQVLLRRAGKTRPSVILVLDGKAFVLTPEESAGIRAQLLTAETILATGSSELALLPIVGEA